ncbi:ABC transporter ATP-binding protein [Staphylococcus condimenti]|uniref:Putative hemin import ATP-binding protein HrtA n=1 Tax=Staphylococcus condimenti TaxID=70255 RepID=A0AB37H9W7_9STAP|nr:MULTISPECIES: ABC transporter ATP-binding protein [Staphylococcus]AMY06395.1 hemin ABC transporter ATP-binding protein [Staphylococcus condimenti]APR60278.1 hemin ABC transporter ATP-binding protein [Staphylococcus condimenti]MDK8644263.1 ABC transporter ATP-binding protein [Staphylococcus condimenti]OFP00239.1 hemin ABC transporter ATP-binding protein [Staphylococcus sp. HMSC065E08]PNZ59256.1 ABC transporter ATP-binding protein [Staphylococcus condimenti]
MTLEVKDITKSFGTGEAKTDVLKGVDFDVKQGEFIILSGASGSGKSTLLTILGGLQDQDSGEILYNGKPLFTKDKSKAEMRLTEIGFIFQASHLVPYLTVLEQLTIVGREAGMSKGEADKRARKLLEQIGLKHRLKAYPHMLSGGEKQRVAIMRAFMNEPKIILADEPTASLDAHRAVEVTQMIRDRITNENMVGIMITHDQRLFKYADRVIDLFDGKILNKEDKSEIV